MRDSAAPGRLPHARCGVLFVFLGVVLGPVAPPLGLLLFMAGFLPPYYAWRQAHFLPSTLRHCLLPRWRPALARRSHATEAYVEGALELEVSLTR